MFYPFTRSEIAPQALPENPDGSGTYFLETNLVSDNRIVDSSLPDFWRVSPNGWATLVRAYREDRSRDQDGQFDRDRKPGTWLSPETPIRETAELVRHAYLFSKYFSSSTAIEFDCQWKGLKDRELKDCDPGVYWSPGRVSRSDIRKATGIWPISELLDNWPNVVAALSCPVLEIFGLDFARRILYTKWNRGFENSHRVMTNSDTSGEFSALQYPVLTLFHIWLQSFTPARWTTPREGLPEPHACRSPRSVNGGAKMPHARRPGGPVAAAQKCATYGPLSVLARGGGCTAWSSMRRWSAPLCPDRITRRP